MTSRKSNLRYFLFVLFVSSIVYISGCGESKPIQTAKPPGGTASDTSANDPKTQPSSTRPDTTKRRN